MPRFCTPAKGAQQFFRYLKLCQGKGSSFLYLLMFVVCERRKSAGQKSRSDAIFMLLSKPRRTTSNRLGYSSRLVSCVS